MDIRFITTEDASRIAALHVKYVNKGFVSSLGPEFVQLLYESLASSPHSFGFIAVDDGEIKGYISCADDIGKIYKLILMKHFFKLVWVLLPHLFKWKTLKDIWQTLFYPHKQSHASAVVEILAIVVIEDCQGLGLGRKLVAQAIDKAIAHGADKIAVMVDEPLPANVFYKHLGFEQTSQYYCHGHLANIYEKKCEEPSLFSTPIPI